MGKVWRNRYQVHFKVNMPSLEENSVMKTEKLDVFLPRRSRNLAEGSALNPGNMCFRPGGVREDCQFNLFDCDIGDYVVVTGSAGYQQAILPPNPSPSRTALFSKFKEP